MLQAVVQMVLFSGLATAPQISAVVPNIGGRSHNLFIQLQPTTPGACQPPQTVEAMMEASFDGLTYTTFGPTLRQIGSGNSALLAASGAFPYIRARVKSFDTTQCRLNAWYSSTVGEHVMLVPTPPGGEPVLIGISNLTTGNSTRYLVRPTASDRFALYVRGPTESPVREVGTRNGEPFERFLGYTDSAGRFFWSETVSNDSVGVYDTVVEVGPGVGTVRLNRIVYVE